MTITATPPTARPPEYVVATTTPPEIICPPWCQSTPDEHAEDLRNWEGFVVHTSGDLGPAPHFRFGASTYVDGSPSPDYPELTVSIGSVSAEELTLDELENFARELLTAVEAVRA